MSRIIFHIDANSAYLSWEAVYRLQHGAEIDLREIPSIVGGDEKKRHGIVLAKSIPAKKYNIITGESVHSALQKCPDLVIVPPNYERYINASNSMIDLLSQYSPHIQRYSIDEVFMDFSNTDTYYLDTAYEIKDRIKKELGFTVNIGIGPNKLLAKVASDFKKPDKVHTLFSHEIAEKMWPLAVENLFMVGLRTKSKLNSRGIYTIGELAKLNRDYLYSWLKKPGLLIWDYANGIENSDVKGKSPPIKSVGNSTTTAFDVETSTEAHKVLLALCEMVGMRIRNLNSCGSVISVGLKNNNFIRYSHQRKLDIPTSSTNTIYKNVVSLFNEVWTNEPLRHLSVSISDISSDEFFQLSLLENYNKRDKILDETIDKLRFKFGYNSVIRSCFLHSGINPIIGGVMMEEEYPMMSSKL